MSKNTRKKLELLLVMLIFIIVLGATLWAGFHYDVPFGNGSHGDIFSGKALNKNK